MENALIWLIGVSMATNELEESLYEKGFKLIVGVDEVGRGCLAGPVVAGAVILPRSFDAPVDDSKKLSEKKRNELYDTIRAEAIAYSVGVVEAEVIDKIDIHRATIKAMQDALNNLSLAPDYMLIDAITFQASHIPVDSIVKGDAKVRCIAAASILAKVYRDRLMVSMSRDYPEYDFASNKGYGTKVHIDAINTCGPCKIHRMSFAPIKHMFQNQII